VRIRGSTVYGGGLRITSYEGRKEGRGRKLVEIEIRRREDGRGKKRREEAWWR